MTRPSVPTISTPSASCENVTSNPKRLSLQEGRALLKKSTPSSAKSKYRNIRTSVDGRIFASGREADRYIELRLLERAGEIHHLECQFPFPLVVNGAKCGIYIADFVYFDGQSHIVEDSKGFRTPIYKLKKKLVEALYDVKIRET